MNNAYRTNFVSAGPATPAPPSDGGRRRPALDGGPPECHPRHYSLSSGTVRSGSKGFSLLEVVVAVGLFSLLLIIVLGIFSRYVFTQRRDIGEHELQEDLRFAIELINREIRTGYGNTYETDGTTLYLRNQNSVCVTYQWTPATQSLRRAQAPGTDSCQMTYNEDTYQTLTGRGTVISNLVFSATPAGVAGGELTSQGFVIMSLHAHARHIDNKEIKLQSAVTSRQLIPYNSEGL